MASLTHQLAHELGYDPDDGVPQVADVLETPPAIGEIVRAREGAVPMAVARLGSGRLVVVEDTCPHDGGRISDGFVEGDMLVCSRHNWELEVAEGSQICRRACAARKAS